MTHPRPPILFTHRRRVVIFLILAVAVAMAVQAQEFVPERTPEPRHEQETIRTIVLDAGHGGEEVGAVGKTGVFEKDLALDIARRLRDRLRSNQGMNVILTREDDRVLPLRDRTAIANHAKADLFLSIHLNSSRRLSAHGTETYFLALTASDEEAMSLAQAENLPAGGSGAGSAESQGEPSSGPSDLEMVLWGMAQSEHLVKSSRLAEVIQDEMNRLLGVPSRGIKQAPFTVLMGAIMPAVLVEVAFLSNEQEEKDLTSVEFRDRVAQALESAILRFKTQTEEALTAAPTTPGRP